MRSLYCLCCLAAFLLAGSASAQEILSRAERDFPQVIPPPPADTSPAGLADLDTLLQIQKERTPAQVARAQRVNGQSVFSFARPVLGEWFTSKNLPRTQAIFIEIDHEERDSIESAKRTEHRPRPFLRDARVVPVVNKPSNDSYPSGHSSNAAVWAAVLTTIFPEDGPAFQDQVRETMWCRELAGVHYPTDTEAGLIIGNAIAKRMLAAPAMAKDLADIRAEIAPFLSKKPAQDAVNPHPSAGSE